MTGTLKQARWLVVCVLGAVLMVSGCADQSVSFDKVASPSVVSDNPEGSALEAPQLPLPTETPKPEPSPTRAPATPTATPAPSPTPTATPISSPTPTPTPALRRLTTGECCTQPFWSPDSQQVLFIDKPGPDLPLGIWGVDVSQVEPTPGLITERIAFYSADLAFRLEVGQDSVVVERLPIPLASTGSISGTTRLAATNPLTETELLPGTRWEVATGGQPVTISPGRSRIAWQASDDDLPVERRITQVWVAKLDGSAPEMVASLPRGGFSGWVSDDVLLLSGRDSLQSQEQTLFTLSLADGSQRELARGERLRGGLVSPGGRWLAYFSAQDPDTAQNGVWLVSTDGSQGHKLERDLFGAYQWRDGHRLLVIPFQPEAVSHEIWEFDADTGQARRLTDPEAAPFKIANGDWAVSPDGHYVAFVESRDRNIWLLALPD